MIALQAIILTVRIEGYIGEKGGAGVKLKQQVLLTEVHYQLRSTFEEAFFA